MKVLYKTIYLSLSIAAISGTAFADNESICKVELKMKQRYSYE
jgi:TRAP-type C4-dicarboxylate transport system permease large subunit